MDINAISVYIIVDIVRILVFILGMDNIKVYVSFFFKLSFVYNCLKVELQKWFAETKHVILVIL